MEWVRAHEDAPYPSDEEKRVLADRAGTTVERLSNFFVNYRSRVWVGSQSGGSSASSSGSGSGASHTRHASVAGSAGGSGSSASSSSGTGSFSGHVGPGTLGH
jgi:hypothetical protein